MAENRQIDRREYMARWRAENREHINAYQRRWRAVRRLERLREQQAAAGPRVVLTAEQMARVDQFLLELENVLRGNNEINGGAE